MICVLYKGLISSITKKPAETIDNRGRSLTIAELINLLIPKYGEEFSRLVINSEKSILKLPVLVNGEARSLDWVVSEGDEVTFILPVYGG